MTEFRAAFPGGSVTKVDPATFNQYVSMHRVQGRLLTGQALAAAVAASPRSGNSTPSAPTIDYAAIAAACDSVAIEARPACRDSLKAKAMAKSHRLNSQYSEESLIFPATLGMGAWKEGTDSSRKVEDSLYLARAARSQAMNPRGRAPAGPSRSEWAQLEIRDAPSDTAAVGPRAIREMKLRDAARKDSIARDSSSFLTPYHEADGDPDTLVLGVRQTKGKAADHTRADDYEEEQRTGWFINLFGDFRDGHGGSGGGWDGDEWAAVIYVVIGVVVVGAFVIYGVQTLAELAINKDEYPMFMEAGLRLSYSGKAFRDPNGNGDLYRDAYLAGLRYAIGFDRPGMGIGLTVEGGYIDIFMRGIDDPTRTFDFKGGYLVAGPMLRFGDNDPWSFSLEFLNGTSNHSSIGWISKSRMTLQAKVARHTLVGAHLGAVFYDLHFLDGLGVREGNFNRDLSLVYGLDTGWEF